MARILPLIAAVLGLLVAAAPAPAASRTAIIRDCEDDSRLSGTYTAKELRDARSNLPSDTDAYSDCRDVLGAALAASAARGRTQAGSSPSGGGNALEGGTGGGTGGGGTGSGDATPPPPPLEVAPGAPPLAPTDAEKQALSKARANPPAIDGRGRPSTVGLAGQAATATFPTSLTILLVLLGLTVVMAAAPSARRRVLRRRTA